MEDLRRAVAFIFKREGTRRMARRDITLAAAMDLHWFGPQDAERLVDAAIRGGMIAEKEGKLEVAFHPQWVAIPSDFRPGRAVLDSSSSEDVMLLIAEEVSRLRGIERAEVLRRVNAKVKSANVEAEAAALLIAAQEGADVSAFVARARESMLARGKR